MEQNIEKIIGTIICNKLPVEWMRYNMFSSKDIYINIPILVFRLSKSDSNERVIEPGRCVESFQGQNSWKVFKDPLYCEQAIEDIPLLAEHINKHFV